MQKKAIHHFHTLTDKKITENEGANAKYIIETDVDKKRKKI
jgi:hypothetical protein